MRPFLTSLTVLAAVATTRVASAAPAGDLVFVWAPPGTSIAPVTAAATRAGAALLDRSPAAAPAGELAEPFIQRGIDAYDALHFDDARTALAHAAELVDRDGAATVTSSQLADLWLYRGLVAAQQGDTATAWDDTVASIIVAPERVLDPARFPPRVVEDLHRARAAIVAAPQGTLDVARPAGCAARVDGAELALPAPLPVGAHWIHVTCSDRAPWSGRVEVVAPATRIVADPVAYAALDATDVLVQARTSGARAFVTAELHGEVATARLISVDGRELGRRTVAIVHGDLSPLGAAVGDLLAPSSSPPPPAHWYQSKWAWAGGAAIVAAAVLVPLTAVIVHDDRATSATVRITGLPW